MSQGYTGLGTAGKSVLNGTGAPASGVGIDGEFYIDTSAWDIYGPKASGAWGSPSSLIGGVGPAGPGGGVTINNGAGPPGVVGGEGDFYIDTTAWDIYGPKTAGVWGGATSLLGPVGAQGDPGVDGVDGAPGIDGEDGTPGNDGLDGADGKTVLNGVIAPGGGNGNDGDFWINTATNLIYGPKAAGAWPAGVSLVGPAGATGSTGAAGAAGVNGRTVLNGTGAPGGGLGIDGDFYLDTAASGIYGPKTAGAWGSPTSLIGPTGSTGATGPQGDPGDTGATGAQGDPGPTGATGAAGPGNVILESSGPTSLAVGAIANGKFTKRVGSTFVSDDIVAADVGGLGTLATQSGTFSGTSSGNNTGDQTVTLTGDVTGSGVGSFAATIANDAVTYAKIQNVSATDKLLGRSTAGSGDVEEVACTAAGRALIDDTDASAQRTTLGLGNVDNTSDAAKPVSTAQQTALNLKANLASPALSGIPTVPTAASGTNTTQAASTAFVEGEIALAVAGLLDFKGSTDASANPNYPAALKGDTYYITVAGKIGGASGKSVDVGDAIVASADNSGGTEASVGANWFVLEHNLTGALLSANNLSDLANAGTARTNLGLGTLATQSGTFSGTSSGTNTGDQSTVSGLAGSATILATARTINGVSFDGSGNITVPAAADTLTGTTLTALSGVNLTALNASNLASGTVPDARFPATLPVASGVNLTALNATNLASGTVATARLPATATEGSIVVNFDGGGSPLTAGLKATLYIPYACTITQATLIADVSGSLVLDGWRDSYTNHPPTIADTIVASAKPTLSAAVKSKDTTLTGWTTAIPADSTMIWNVDSATTVTKAQLVLSITRT